jgi:hypothetical protein
MGPPKYAVRETYKSGLDREPPKSNLSKGCWGVLLPPRGECDLREDGRCQSKACVGAGGEGAACGRARFDAVDDKEMAQP